MRDVVAWHPPWSNNMQLACGWTLPLAKDCNLYSAIMRAEEHRSICYWSSEEIVLVKRTSRQLRQSKLRPKAISSSCLALTRRKYHH